MSHRQRASQKAGHIPNATTLALLAAAALSGALLGPAYGANKTAANGETNPTTSMTLAKQPEPVPDRRVEVVVVWGFRLRSVDYDRRTAATLSGYEELVRRDDCVTQICGFVVARNGAEWRHSNVMAGSESELIDRQAQMAREGTSLVIVHPTGRRRTVPKF